MNELGKYSEAQSEIEAVHKSPAFASTGESTRGWGLSELAAALYLQNKPTEYEIVANEAFSNGANFKTYLPKIIKKYQANDKGRLELQKIKAQLNSNE